MKILNYNKIKLIFNTGIEEVHPIIYSEYLDNSVVGFLSGNFTINDRCKLDSIIKPQGEINKILEPYLVNFSVVQEYEEDIIDNYFYYSKLRGANCYIINFKAPEGNFLEDFELFDENNESSGSLKNYLSNFKVDNQIYCIVLIIGNNVFANYSQYIHNDSLYPHSDMGSIMLEQDSLILINKSLIDTDTKLNNQSNTLLGNEFNDVSNKLIDDTERGFIPEGRILNNRCYD